MNDPGLVHPELDLAGPDLVHGLGHVERHGACLGVGHETARAEHLAQTSHQLHHVGSRHHGLEIEPTLLDALDDLVAADLVGTSLLRLALLLARGDHEHAPCLAAQAVGKNDRPSHHLVGMLRIDPQAHRDLDRLVELRKGALLDQCQRFLQRVRWLRLDHVTGLGVLLSDSSHRKLLSPRRLAPADRGSHPISAAGAPGGLLQT